LSTNLIQGSAWLRSHQDWGENFPEWKLYESARSCYNVFTNRLHIWDDFQVEMAELCDFQHGRINNSIIMQNMSGCAQSILTSMWDGMQENDVQLVTMECLKLCVS